VWLCLIYVLVLHSVKHLITCFFSLRTHEVQSTAAPLRIQVVLFHKSFSFFYWIGRRHEIQCRLFFNLPATLKSKFYTVSYPIFSKEVLRIRIRIKKGQSDPQKQKKVQPSALKRKHPTLQIVKFFNFILFLWVIFALLNPDLDSESGPRPFTLLIESGSDPNP
jgi:hypothetical protein